MISSQCFTKEWISAQRARMRGGEPILIEKTIHAFALLGHLCDRGLPMVFKGGTSLLLRLPRFRRLSIDVDILCPLPDGELDRILAEVAAREPFLRCEEDDRGPNRIPARRHFKFHYRPIASHGEQTSHVILDVVKEEAIHPIVEPVVIHSELFEIEREVRAPVPTIECLLGDKLTAFAPNTIGVPCNEQYAMQVMKQLFDIGELFDAASDFRMVERAYEAHFAAENGYRGGRYSRNESLEDTIETARILCQSGLKGAAQHADREMLLRGRTSLAGHLVGTRFSVDDAKVAAAKAACLAIILKVETPDRLTGDFRYAASKADQLRNVKLTNPVLQRLRGGNPEAFHYWALGEGVLSAPVSP